MMNAFLLLVALLFAPSAHSLAPASVEEAGFSLRGASESSGVVDVEHRQLSWGSGFDFSNLLFHLGVCTEHSCEYCAQHHPVGPPLPHCGCPHCDLPHAHKLPQCSCTSSSGSSSTSSTESSTESDVAEESDESAASDGGESNLSNSQTATSRFSLVMYAAGAAACAALIAAVVMRKRDSSREIDLNSEGLSPDAANAVNLSLSTKFAALMAGLGMGVPAVVTTQDYADMDDVAPYEPGPVSGAEGYAI